MGDLFCNSSVENTENGAACKDVKYNLQYTVPYLNCGRYDGGGQYLQHNCQDFTQACLKNSALEALPAAAPKLEQVVLGKPPEWPDNSFNLFSTCPNSQARAHTMAEMTVDFTNSCSDVMAEISARAGSAANGGTWVDPHNKGHYSVLATEGNLIKVQRYTARYKYKDVKYNLQYTVPYLNCGRYDGGGQYLQHNCQDFTQACLKNSALESPQKVLRYI